MPNFEKYMAYNRNIQESVCKDTGINALVGKIRTVRKVNYLFNKNFKLIDYFIIRMLI